MKQERTGSNGAAAALHVRLTVWLCRIVVGAVFILSGWAKAIDPWGFLYKMEEYMAVWQLELPREILLSADVALSCIEFTTGVLIITGCLRRVAVWCSAAMMAVMLPLTVYIAVADPVSDCGCFGDMFVISNTSTLIKNIILTAAIVWLILRNTSVRGIYSRSLQWLVVAVSLAYPLYLALYGYQIQPLVDFRPFKTGTSLKEHQSDETGQPVYIYEKDGVRKEFPLNEMPDSTWTYVDAVDFGKDDSAITVFDPESGDDLTDEVICTGNAQLLLVVTDPGVQFLSRAHYVNDLNRYLSGYGVEMLALVGTYGTGFERWRELTNPDFEAYSVEDTTLKQLVRGDAAVVYLDKDGKILWKRTLHSLDANLPYLPVDASNALDAIEPSDSGRDLSVPTAIWASVLLILYFLAIAIRRNSAKKSYLCKPNQNELN